MPPIGRYAKARTTLPGKRQEHPATVQASDPAASDQPTACRRGHSQEMMKVEAGAELQQAIEAIPVGLGISITPEQEADLPAAAGFFVLAN